jgi:predicted MFS family arabinose efflux permease
VRDEIGYTQATAFSSPVEEYVFGKSHSLKILLSLSLLMTFDFADRMIIAGLLPIIKEEWRITDTEAGLLSSVLYLGMVIFVFPASLLIDRWSRLKMASLTGVFWSLSSAAGAWTKSFSELVVTRAFVGIGEAGYAPAAYVWISAAFPGRRRQLALGIFSTGQPIGMAVGVALGGYVGKMLGWHQALGLMAAPGLLIAILIYRGRDYQNLPVVADSADPLRQSVLHRFGWDSVRAIARSPSLIFAFLAGAMGTLQCTPVFYFLPMFLHRVHGVPAATATYMTSGIMMMVIVSVPLGGWIMDRWSDTMPRAKLVFAWIASAIGTVLFGLAFGAARGCTTQYALIVIATFIIATASTATLSMSQELAPIGARALSGSCFVLVLHLLGSAPGPYFTGLLSDHYGLTTAFLIMCLVSGALALITLLLAWWYYPSVSRAEAARGVSRGWARVCD